VFGAEPGTDPKAAVIWEAFKPDTEPSRTTHADDLAKQRDALMAAIARGRAVGQQRPQDSSGAAESRDFAEEQGGVY
jgi:penicillin-binding protein 1A